jgi:predicted O-methyltransferase YrrM
MKPQRLTTNNELAWIADRAKQCSHIIEVGVWVGHSLKVWADNIRLAGRVVGIDAWDPAYGTAGMSGFMARMGGQEAFEYCQQQLADHISGGRVFLLRGEAVRMSKRLTAGRYDLVYLDAATSELEVTSHLEAFEPLLRSGGTMCGHHYLRRQGARQAIDARYGSKVQHQGQIWWVEL